MILTTCDKVIFLYHGVSSIGIAFIVGDRSAGSIKGFDLLSGPKGFAAFGLEPPKGEVVAFLLLSLPAEQTGP